MPGHDVLAVRKRRLNYNDSDGPARADSLSQLRLTRGCFHARRMPSGDKITGFGRGSYRPAGASEELTRRLGDLAPEGLPMLDSWA